MPTTVRAGAAPTKGAARRDGDTPKFAGPVKTPFGIAIKDDAINQFFWSAWRKGGFDLASLTSLGCDGTVTGGAVSFTSFALLPPILMPATGDSVAIGLGDVQLTGTVAQGVVGKTGAPLNVTLYASAIGTGKMGVTTSGALTIMFAPTPQVAAQLVSISDSTVIEQVGTALVPYFGCVAQQIARMTLETFPAPKLKLKLPASEKELTVKSPKVGREGNYTKLEGEVDSN